MNKMPIIMMDNIFLKKTIEVKKKYFGTKCDF